MAEPAAEFVLLMHRVQAGCPDAIRELFDRYSDPIRRVVRRKLHRRMRSQYDSLDFMQAVWASFFTIPQERLKFESPEALIGFLSNVAFNKVVEAYRQRQTRKRNIFLEKPLQASERTSTDAPRYLPPTPSQYAMADERWERLLQDQPAPYRQILELLRLGHSHREVADRLGLHPKTIQRLLKRLETRIAP